MVANADAVPMPASWSSSEVTQSPAIAAGVDPPTTKWKKRGPDEWVAAAVPTRSSSRDRVVRADPALGERPVELVGQRVARGVPHEPRVQVGEVLRRSGRHVGQHPGRLIRFEQWVHAVIVRGPGDDYQR